MNDTISIPDDLAKISDTELVALARHFADRVDAAYAASPERGAWARKMVADMEIALAELNRRRASVTPA